MVLRKWCSNDPRLAVDVSNTSEDEHVIQDLKDNDSSKTLGLIWKPKTDQLLFKVTPHAKEQPYTKRTLLADLNRVFDPLGFLSPVLIRGKMFIQELWQLQLEWDTALPKEMYNRWSKYMTELSEIDSLQIVRKAKSRTDMQFELHGFCDASNGAYGTCVYVRQLQVNNRFEFRLLATKAQVAPLKSITIPRLELSSTLVLANLMSKITTALVVSSGQCTCWSDSSAALTWIRGISSKWSTFVSNRISEIQTLTDGMTWRHVRTAFNPADIVSRGLTVSNLLNNVTRWNGPTFLQSDQSEWPEECVVQPVSEQLEKRPMKFTLLVQSESNELLHRYSNWSKLIRITALIQRFVSNAMVKKELRRAGSLSSNEIKKPKLTWIKLAQKDSFNEERKALEESKPLDQKSNIVTLSPFMDDKVIRVGGRLQCSNLYNDQRHPAILPKKHQVTELIFREYHNRFLHAGPQNLLVRIGR